MSKCPVMFRTRNTFRPSLSRIAKSRSEIVARPDRSSDRPPRSSCSLPLSSEGASEDASTLPSVAAGTKGGSSRTPPSIDSARSSSALGASKTPRSAASASNPKAVIPITALMTQTRRLTRRGLTRSRSFWTEPRLERGYIAPKQARKLPVSSSSGPGRRTS